MTSSSSTPFNLSYINNSFTCYIYPRVKFPDGLLLTYEKCPEVYDNQTMKIIRYCCLSIMFERIQQSTFKKIQDFLRYNSSTLLVVPAVLFNILSLVVLKRFQRRSRTVNKTSTTFYMRCLCIFDTLTILSKFLYEILVVRNGLRKHPFVINSFMCKFMSFSESLFAITSIYLLIAMTIDKLICVLFPLKVANILTPTKARIILSCILMVSGLISSYNLFDKRVFELASDPLIEQDQTTSYATTTTTTSSTSSLNNFISNSTLLTNNINTRIVYDCDSKWPNFKNDWTLFNNMIRVFMPFSILCVCNSWIAIALAKAARKAEALFGDSSLNSIGYNNNNTGTTSLSLLSPPSLRRTSQSFKHVVKFKQIKMDLNLSDCSPLRNKKNSNYFLNDSLNANNNSTLGVCEDSYYENYRKMSTFSNFNRRVNVTNNSNVLTARNTSQHISLMLLAVSIGFIVFNIPFAIRTLFHRQFSEKFKILDYLYHDDNLFRTRTSKIEIENAVIYEFFSSFTHFLLDLNFIANFFLYFFSGSRFRSQLYMLFKCCNRGDIKSSLRRKNFTNSHFLQSRIAQNKSKKSGDEDENNNNSPVLFNNSQRISDRGSNKLKNPFVFLKNKLFGSEKKTNNFCSPAKLKNEKQLASKQSSSFRNSQNSKSLGDNLIFVSATNKNKNHKHFSSDFEYFKSSKVKNVKSYNNHNANNINTPYINVKPVFYIKDSEF
jgi:hypothetical protein